MHNTYTTPAARRARSLPVAATIAAFGWLLLALGCAGASSPPVTSDADALDVSVAAGEAESAPSAAEYQLGAGDQLRVTVFGHDNLSGEFEIDGAGNLSLPLIRVVPAQGLTTQELESLVASKLQPDYLRNPRVSVDVVGYRPFYILGEVRNPGSYPFVSNMTVVNAVAVAGGYSYRASKKKMTIIRANDPEQKKRRITEATRVFPGDVIEVPERFF